MWIAPTGRSDAQTAMCVDTRNRDKLWVLVLNEYQRDRLLAELNSRELADTGDWHGELRFMLVCDSIKSEG